MSDPVAIDSAAAAPGPVSQSPKVKKGKAATAGPKKPKSKPNHPPTSEMVNGAIKSLKERGGSSLQAIKKYISVNYKIDADKLSPFIKKYLKNAVIAGQLIQTKGKGASGSFKLKAVAAKVSAGEGKKVKKSSDKPKKVTTAKKSPTKKPAAKKVSAKKPVGEKKKTVGAAKAVKKSGTSVKAASKQKPTKAKKSGDAVKKPKAPKPKKASSPKKSAVKK